MWPSRQTKNNPSVRVKFKQIKQTKNNPSVRVKFKQIKQTNLTTHRLGSNSSKSITEMHYCKISKSMYLCSYCYCYKVYYKGKKQIPLK